jgi:hypothetical protein
VLAQGDEAGGCWSPAALDAGQASSLDAIEGGVFSGEFFERPDRRPYPIGAS